MCIYRICKHTLHTIQGHRVASSRSIPPGAMGVLAAEQHVRVCKHATSHGTMY